MNATIDRQYAYGMCPNYILGMLQFNSSRLVGTTKIALLFLGSCRWNEHEEGRLRRRGQQTDSGDIGLRTDGQEGAGLLV